VTSAVIDNTHWIAVVKGKIQRVSSASKNATPETLSQDSIGANIADFDFASVTVGWAITASYSCANRICVLQTQLYRTQDGGRKWQPLILPETNSAIPNTTTIITNRQGFDTCDAPDPTVAAYWKAHGDGHPPMKP
jgi:hypothetical protein